MTEADSAADPGFLDVDYDEYFVESYRGVVARSNQSNVIKRFYGSGFKSDLEVARAWMKTHRRKWSDLDGIAGFRRDMKASKSTREAIVHKLKAGGLGPYIVALVAQPGELYAGVEIRLDGRLIESFNTGDLEADILSARRRRIDLWKEPVPREFGRD